MEQINQPCYIDVSNFIVNQFKFWHHAYYAVSNNTVARSASESFESDDIIAHGLRRMTAGHLFFLLQHFTLLGAWDRMHRCATRAHTHSQIRARLRADAAYVLQNWFSFFFFFIDLTWLPKMIVHSLPVCAHKVIDSVCGVAAAIFAAVEWH